jgi:phenylalanyl-tRNA synthetase beta chain
MKTSFYSAGKLLITGEYAVLDGAYALAIPTRFGQTLSVMETSSGSIDWKSFDVDQHCWLEASFSVNTLELRSEHTEESENLGKLLQIAQKLNPAFLKHCDGLKVETHLQFSRKWGLGSSSTLLNNIAQWAAIDPYQLLKNRFSGTKFTTLDGVERELHEDDLMICSDDRPLCIAGVLGGMDSGVTENTSQVFLESAYFNPVSIRKTAKRHSINTDASFRFERGIDIELTEYALKRAAILINQLAGGTITSDVIDEYTVKFEETQVVLNFDKITKMIGQEIPRETIKSILTSLDIKINNVTEAGIGVIVPSYRVDVTREADLVEEILRVYGYNNIEFSKKIATSLIFSDKINLHQIENRMADQLISQGFFEMMNNSLTTPDHNKEVAEMVTMLNPLSQDLSVMRTSLLFQSLESIAYNLNRKQQDCKFFEFGKTYFPAQEGYTEHKHLVLAITGNQTAETWTQENLKSNFFYLKGVVEALMVRLGIRCKEQPTNSKEFSEGIDFVYNKKIIASLGLVASHLTNPLGITQQTLFADLQWDVVIEALKHTKTKFKHIPKNPAVRRDFALLLDKEIAYKDLYDTAYKTERNLLKSVSLFDVYEGKNLPENKKSYALSFTLQDQNKTLTDKQVDKVMNSIQSEFEKSFGAQLR